MNYKLALSMVIPVTVLALAADVLLYQRYSTGRPILRMDDAKVTRKEYQDRLDYLYGKQVLNKLVYDKLVRKAALRQKLAPTQDEVQERIDRLQERSPAAFEQMREDPTRLQDLHDDIWTGIALENLRIAGVKASDTEVQTYYAQHRSQLAQPMRIETTIVVARNKSDADGAADMLRQKILPGVLARQPRLAVVGANWQPDWQKLPITARQQLGDAVKKIPVGGVAVIPIVDIFFIVRVDRRDAVQSPTLMATRKQVDRLVRLSKAPSPQITLAHLYREANVQFDVARYAAYFEDIRAFAEKQKSTSTASLESVVSSQKGDP